MSTRSAGCRCSREAGGPRAKVRIQEQSRTCGGQIATALATCASLGLRAAYLGAVGDDDDGRRIRGELEARGIDLGHVEIEPGRHGDGHDPPRRDGRPHRPVASRSGPVLSARPAARRRDRGVARAARRRRRRARGDRGGQDRARPRHPRHVRHRPRHAGHAGAPPAGEPPGVRRERAGAADRRVRTRARACARCAGCIRGRWS